MDTKIYYDANFKRMALGDFGFDVLDVNSDINENQFYGALQLLEDSSLSFINDIELKGEDVITGLELPKGFTIFGNFKSLAVVSGKVIAYRRG